MEVLAILLVLLILFMVIWYATPYYLIRFIEKKADALPDYKLRIHWIQINPIACSCDLEGLVLQKKSNLIPVPFFVADRVHVAMQWTQLIHFDLRSNITLLAPVVNFVHGPTAETSQTILEPAWVTAVKQIVPLRINQFKIHNGDVHYYDFHAEPKINLQIMDLDLEADNLTNTTKSKDLMPQSIRVSAHPISKSAGLEALLRVNVDIKPPTFSEKISLDKVPLTGLNSFIAKYSSVYAKSGTFSLYSECLSENGGYKGYLRPYFKNLVFEPLPKDKDSIAALWSTIANGVKDILENGKTDTVATDIPVKGNYSDPKMDYMAAFFGILQNAYIHALTEQFKTPELAPGGHPPVQPKLDKPVAPKP